MSDGRTVLKKIAFQMDTIFFRFAINPTNLQYSNPHRTTAIKTKSRIVIEDFQNDIPTVTLSGSTGFNPTGKKEDRGIAKIKEMKAFLESYGKTGGNGNNNAVDLIFHDFTNDESYVVTMSPEGVTYSQDVSQPLLHNYEIKFIILRKASEPADDQIVNPEIGNPYPSIATNGTVPPSNYGTVQLPPISPYLPNLGTTPPPPIQKGSGAGSSSSGTNSYGSNSGSSSSDTNGNKPYDPSSGNPNIYNNGTSGPYSPSTSGNEPINPQAPSPSAYQYGMTGLGFNIGYYGRSY